jgi:hypothetical protein
MKPRRQCFHCRTLAVAVVKVGGHVFREGTKIEGSGSAWAPVCEKHLERYPDHDGFSIETKQ